MLYAEFLNGTKARETEATFKQYQLIEQIYNECESMTKEEAYKIWMQTYGRQEKINRERILKMIKAMSEYRDPYGAVTLEQQAMRKRLFQAATSVADTNEFRCGYSKAEITNPEGVTYQLEKCGDINAHIKYKLVIKYEGKRYETGLTYWCGDFRIKAA